MVEKKAAVHLELAAFVAELLRFAQDIYIKQLRIFTYLLNK